MLETATLLLSRPPRRTVRRGHCFLLRFLLILLITIREAKLINYTKYNATMMCNTNYERPWLIKSTIMISIDSLIIDTVSVVDSIMIFDSVEQGLSGLEHTLD